MSHLVDIRVVNLRDEEDVSTSDNKASEDDEEDDDEEDGPKAMITHNMQCVAGCIMHNALIFGSSRSGQLCLMIKNSIHLD